MTRAQFATNLRDHKWVFSAVVVVAGALGVQAVLPGPRLQAVERHNIRQDSILQTHERSLEAYKAEQSRTLNEIQDQMSRLIAGQCVKERDRMARIVYGCR